MNARRNYAMASANKHANRRTAHEAAGSRRRGFLDLTILTGFLAAATFAVLQFAMIA